MMVCTSAVQSWIDEWDGMGWDWIDWLIGDFEYALKVIYDSESFTHQFAT